MPSNPGMYKGVYAELQGLLGVGLKHVNLVPILGINEGDSWKSHFKQMVDQGKEGLVLRAQDARYKYSSTSAAETIKCGKSKPASRRKFSQLRKLRESENSRAI